MRYHSLKDGSYTLCTACYTAGRFPSTMYAGGFVRMDDEAFKHASGDDWSDQETLLLLEGVEMFDEDWAKVAEHVGSRSKEQCILHFLQLPIEDPYLASEGAALGPLQYAASIGRSVDGQPGANALPFSQTDNPVMSVVAFLASAVSPGVAAAAAQRALGELTEDLKKRAEQAAANKDKADKEAVAEGDKDKEGGIAQDAEMKVDGEGASGDKPETAEETGKEDGDAMQVDTAEAPAGDVAEAPAAATSEAPAPAVEATPAVNGHTDSASPAIPRADVSRIASLALGSAAAKASVLATHEERRIESLVTRLVSAQMRKLELKMTLFERFEEMLEAEKRQIEVQKQQFYKEKLTLQGQLQIVQNAIKRAQEQPGAANGELKSTVEGVDRALNTASAAGVRETGVETAEVPTDGQVQTLA